MKTLQELLACTRTLRDGYFGTVSGHSAYVLDPARSHLSIQDIATVLSRVPRFGGHTRGPIYSVAQHSVMVARLVSPANRLAALLHDATEAYLGDLISPLKREVPHYKLIETRWAAEIGLRAGVDLVHLDEEIKRADLTMLLSEHRQLQADNPDGPQWGFGFDAEDVVPIERVWSEVNAELEFMGAYLAVRSPLAQEGF
jgi:hypothetical protein